MTEPVERPHASQDEVPPPEPHGEPLPLHVETHMAVQQLREAGFSEDQQAALTTALLRVLALWTQQATRGDLHAEHQALTQRLAQQLDALREDTRREIGHHADALREDMRREVGQHADTLRAELRDALAQHAALLGLTAVGVILLVVSRFVGP